MSTIRRINPQHTACVTAFVAGAVGLADAAGISAGDMADLLEIGEDVANEGLWTLLAAAARRASNGRRWSIPSDSTRADVISGLRVAQRVADQPDPFAGLPRF